MPGKRIVMRKKLIKIGKRRVVLKSSLNYTKIKSEGASANTRKYSINLNKDDAGRGESLAMTEIVQKLNNIKLPPHVMRELGLESNWQKNVSPEFMEKIIQTAEKYKGALRRLSKY